MSAGKKSKKAGIPIFEIGNVEAWSRWAQISIFFVNTPFQAFGRQPA
jgi:hypothetical protein